jgi:CubicO group peptidase (beta-lactamase class C family)
MKTWKRTLIAIALVLGASYASYAPSAQQRSVTPPESVGVSTERLGRLHQGMQAFVDRRDVGGIVTLAARDGKVVDVHASGFQDVESKTPMKTDTIFRIASMSKPITSVAVMMLYEEGKLLLTDQASKYIPAFKSSVVMAADGTTTPARRGITIRDLLSHRSGITYGFLNNGAVGNV